MNIRPKPISRSLDLRNLSEEDERSLESSFWIRVHRDRTDGCWRFGGHRVPRMPYEAGVVYFRKQIWVPARISWALKYGKIEKGKYLWHTCGITNCVNPDHLKYGDKRAMERWFDDRPVLSTYEQKEIRNLYFNKYMPLHELRDKYQITDREVRKIIGL